MSAVEAAIESLRATVLPPAFVGARCVTLAERTRQREVSAVAETVVQRAVTAQIARACHASAEHHAWTQQMAQKLSDAGWPL